VCSSDLTALCLMAWGILAYLVFEYQVRTSRPLPTLMALPSLTASPSSTQTAIVTATFTASDTVTPTNSATPTATFTPPATPTLSVRLIEIVAVMPGVTIQPTETPFPDGTILLPAPPQPLEPLTDATNQPPPYTGWIS